MRPCPRFAFLAVAVLAAAFLNPSRASAGTLYAVTFDFQGIGQPAQLYTVDPASGTSTLVAALNNPFNFTQPMGLEFTPDGRLFAYSGFNLVEINPVTGALRLVDSDSQPGTLEGGLAFDRGSGRFYAAGASNDSIITIAPATGSRQLVGPTGIPGADISGLAFGADGTLFGVALLGAQPDVLVRINLATGAATAIGPTGTNAGRGLAGLAFDPDTGALFLAVNDGQAGLFTVNTATGAATRVGDLRPPGAGPNESIGFVSGLAVQAAEPIPEPASAAVFGLTLLGLAAARRCRPGGAQ